MMPRYVLDASAVLAWRQGEPGAEVVDTLLSQAVISAVNWSEVLRKWASEEKMPAGSEICYRPWVSRLSPSHWKVRLRQLVSGCMRHHYHSVIAVVLLWHAFSKYQR